MLCSSELAPRIPKPVMATITVLEGIWLRVKSEVGSLVNAGDSVDLQMDQTSSTIQITGRAVDVTRLKDRIEERIKDIEDEIQKAKQRITENVDIKDPFQIQQLQMFRFSKATYERFPGLQVKVASKSQKVIFEGLPTEITEAKVYMYQTLNGLPVRKFRPASRNVKEFLKDRDVAKKIYETFKGRNFRATYMVSEEDVVCSSSTEDDMEQAVQILQNSIAEHFIDIKPQFQPAIQKEEWKELVGRLEDEEKVFILPSVSGQRNAVIVVGFKTSLRPVVDKLTNFIKLHTAEFPIRFKSPQTSYNLARNPRY
ncbi:uncharacterized protein [Ptychodera flava]|uniref:uncharacterized protein n=1 Tax=Ptychodera flava TaxID=63121 RepID=UPI003969FB97